MGVYIKNMEMPTSCWDCEVGGAKQMDNATCPFYAMEFWEQENYQDKIADGCPLVPVPVPPHGDLIDRAELWVEINKICDRRDAGIITDLTCLQQILSALRHAPTIIPAELPVLHGTFAATSEKEALKRIAMAEEGEA